jgi:dUTP pyrophosphatase
MDIQVKKLEGSATVPTRAHEYDAGWDLYSAETLTIPSHERATVKTGIAMDVPKGFVGIIYGRSGHASKSGIMKSGGVIDSGYHGEIGVILFNGGKENFKINSGDRIAQLIIHPLPETKVVETETFNTITKRSEKGFGSTGN